MTSKISSSHKTGNILITVDLEDWFQVENLRGSFPHSKWDECDIRLVEPTRRLLGLFKQHDVRATFFVLGWIAERMPELVQEIHQLGHEIASHGFSHQLCYSMDSNSLKQDIIKSKRLLEDVTDIEVYGYRAPNFSVDEGLISLLVELGFGYDASYNDFQAHSRYGSLAGDWVEVCPGLLRDSRGFYEVPVRNLNVLKKKMPWNGGGYFRLLPLWLFKKGVDHFFRKGGQTFVFYCHPWEFDPAQPRIKGLRPDYRFRHYVNIKKNLKKFDGFLLAFSGFRFLTCYDFISQATASSSNLNRF